MADYKVYTGTVNAGTPEQTESINGDLPTIHRCCVSVTSGTSLLCSLSLLDPPAWGDDVYIPSGTPFETSLSVRHVRIKRDGADADYQIFVKG